MDLTRQVKNCCFYYIHNNKWALDKMPCDNQEK